MERKEENPNANPHTSTFISDFLCFTQACFNRPYLDSLESYYSPWYEYELRVKQFHLWALGILSFLFSMSEKMSIWSLLVICSFRRTDCQSDGGAVKLIQYWICCLGQINNNVVAPKRGNRYVRKLFGNHFLY